MAANDSVSKQTLYIAIVVSLVVGALGGIVFSSVQSTTYPRQAARPAPPAGMGQAAPAPAINPQQAGRILALERQVAANPGDVKAWVELGNLYFDANRHAKAISAYNRALELEPGNAHVLTDLGVMYRRNGQPAKAVATFDRAIAAAPQLEQAYFNKGIVLMYDLHDIDGAIAAWQALLKINPNAVASNGTPITKIIDEARKKQAAGGQ